MLVKSSLPGGARTRLEGGWIRSDLDSIGGDPDFAGPDPAVDDELHGWSMVEGVAVAPGKGQGFVGQIGGELGRPSSEGSDISRREVDSISIRNPRPAGHDVSLVLHRPLDPALDLDRLER